MIKRIYISDLFDKKIDKWFEFNEDLNIITGINGAGKTTVLKLVWYIISGNIERIFHEIKLDNVILEHSKFKLEINNKNRKKIKISYKDSKIEEESFFDISDEKDEKDKNLFKKNFQKMDEFFIQIDKFNHLVLKESKYSLFFPTFRRIEGGFSMNKGATNPYGLNVPRFLLGDMGMADDINKAMEGIERRISVENHRLVASISTSDIVELLNKEYLKKSEKVNSINNKLSENIEGKISTNKNIDDKSNNALEQKNEIFEEIRNFLIESKKEKDFINNPFNILDNFIKNLFQHKGIQIDENIVIGTSEDALLSEKLSAGEKQMLSFLCYNAFINNGVIFIDEPEISLHVDWQRIIIKTLMSQNSNNQLIIATHSPFIYSQYENYELLLSDLRGCEDE